MGHEKEIDKSSGVETTGHVWDDDLKELNNPLPRWWLHVFYVCIVWSIGYWILYPAWPTLQGAYTTGTLGYSQRAVVEQEVASALAAQDVYRKGLASTPLVDVSTKAELFQFAVTGGAAVFSENCAGCHGRGAQGGVGYPNLNDDDWLWGGDIASIEATIRYGIRSGHAKGHESAMPRFGIDQVMTPEQINDVAHYVRSLSGINEDKASAERGAALFVEQQCVSCHGADGKGNPSLGAPNLSDQIWLYGNSQQVVMQSIATGRGGVMPAWGDRLDDATVKMLAVYVHSLGGGKK